MMHHMRPVNSVNRRHPIVQPQGEVLIEQIRGFVRAVDGVEGEGGRADGDVQVLADADGQRAGAVARVRGRAVRTGESSSTRERFIGAEAVGWWAREVSGVEIA